MKPKVMINTVIVFILLSSSVWGQEKVANTIAEEEAIKKEIVANLFKSAEYWNNSDLENYMSSYPKREDVLMQSGTSRIYGYTKLYNMYSNLFKDVDKRGVLSFTDVEVTVFANDTAMEIGKFTLEFKDGKKRSAYFTAILKKFADGWKIIHDHS